MLEKKGVHGLIPSFNGGGIGSNTGASGGGATDIRLIDNQEIDGLKSRIIVASGGGGANSYSEGCTGGCGGIIKGEDGKRNGVQGDCIAPTGATQSSGGYKGYPVPSNPNGEGTSGSFGSGGIAHQGWGSGGGGGYFGGGGGSDGSAGTSSGAGGSSYISGYKDCLAISSSTVSISNPIMLSHSYHYSGKVFRQIQVKEGSELQRNDDGHVTITFISNDNCSCARNHRVHDSYIIKLIYIFVMIK